MNSRTPKPIKRPAGFKPNNQQPKPKQTRTEEMLNLNVLRDPFETYTGNISDYYCVDYRIVEPHPRWIRSPFIHKDDLCWILRDLYLMQTDKERTIKGIRIQSEEWLSEMRDTTWDETANEYAKDSITNREYFFGPRYVSIAEAIITKGQNLNS
tara:strand:- start:1514 stop:1975 length:462 start_codon:yes stop_codon:yes gene_type:complete